MIPDFQTLMLPVLELLSTKEPYTLRELIGRLAQKFQLNEEDLREMLSSGNQTVFHNRVSWAKTYLKKAGLLDSPKRATFVITNRGLDLLKQKPERIDIRLLRKYPEFVEFQTVNRTSKEAVEEIDPVPSEAQTPEENLDKSYQQLRVALATDLLGRVLEISPDSFEKMVVELLVRMGYGGSIKDAGRAVGRSGDEGIDGMIKEDKLGLDVIYIQAKRWKPGNQVGRPEVQKFIGALAGQGAKKGILITTSSFTREAREFTPRNETKIVLIDGNELSQLMIDYNLGCTTHQVYEIKRIDNDYFGDE